MIKSFVRRLTWRCLLPHRCHRVVPNHLIARQLPVLRGPAGDFGIRKGRGAAAALLQGVVAAKEGGDEIKAATGRGLGSQEHLQGLERQVAEGRVEEDKGTEGIHKV